MNAEAIELQDLDPRPKVGFTQALKNAEVLEGKWRGGNVHQVPIEHLSQHIHAAEIGMTIGVVTQTVSEASGELKARIEARFQRAQ